ncbi:MAG: hypothetical protein OXH12_03280 [Chloroflexi bacterium]|nr:hypothetical protein [Chloroflexota bacterium]
MSEQSGRDNQANPLDPNNGAHWQSRARMSVQRTGRSRSGRPGRGGRDGEARPLQVTSAVVAEHYGWKAKGA